MQQTLGPPFENGPCDVLEWGDHLSTDSPNGSTPCNEFGKCRFQTNQKQKSCCRKRKRKRKREENEKEKGKEGRE